MKRAIFVCAVAVVCGAGTCGIDGPVEICNNGIDDDGDELVDCEDPDCTNFCAKVDAGPSLPDAGLGEGEGEGEGAGEGEGEGAAGEGEGEGAHPHETPGANNCVDGIDNDGDFLIDAADPGCHDGSPDAETDLDQCGNGVDDDYDGLVDTDDPDCVNGIESNGKLPDLVVVGAQTGDPIFETKNVADDDPELLERCYQAPGLRKVMEFNSVVANLGTAVFDYVSPDAHPNVWTATAFGDNRYQGFLRFQLLNADGNVVAIGHKASFCLEDSTQIDPNAPAQVVPACSGIDIGWADEYPSSLACQYIDVTDVPSGDYTLRQVVNVFHEIPETDYTNNTVDSAVHVP